MLHALNRNIGGSKFVLLNLTNRAMLFSSHLQHQRSFSIIVYRTMMMWPYRSLNMITYVHAYVLPRPELCHIGSNLIRPPVLCCTYAGRPDPHEDILITSSGGRPGGLVGNLETF